MMTMGDHTPYCNDPECRLCLVHLRHERRDAFCDLISDYERLRGYVALKHGEDATSRVVSTWLAENGHGLIIEGIPEADAYRDRFWPGNPKGGGDGATD